MSSIVKNISGRNLIIFGLIGFSATGAQIIFLREFLGAFNGNELSLGIVLSAWLLWTGIGSLITGQFKFLTNQKYYFIIILQILTALTAPLTVIIIRVISASLKTVPGELLGLIPMIISSFIILLPYGLISGGSFTAGVFLLSDTASKNKAVGSVYLLESIGSAASGLILSLILINVFSNLYICFFISILNCFVSFYLAQSIQQKYFKLGIDILIPIIFLGIIFTAQTIQLKSEKIVWKNFNLIASCNSHFGTYFLINTGTNKTVYLDDTKLFSIPDKEAAEETVHFAMLQHPKPESVLLIGGGLNGSIEEILKHPSVDTVIYVETDPVLIEFFKNHFEKEWQQLKMNSKVRLQISDGRLFLRQNIQKYDVIILIQPDPQTAQFNRFFTKEFFKVISTWLKPSGIFSFQTQGSENYINEDMAKYLGCMYKTLKSVFKKVIVLPGNVIHFIAGSEAGELTNNAGIMVSRLQKRHIRTSYIREYYLPFRFSNDRISYLEQTIEKQNGIRINTDFHPLAFYFNNVLWSAQFSPKFTSFIRQAGKISPGMYLLIPLMLLFLLLIIYILRSNSLNRIKMTGALSVICLGATAMGGEILILLIFQIMYGYVYQELAILIATFMAGLSLGTYLSLKFIPGKIQHSIKRLGLIHILTAFTVVLLPYFFQNFIKVINPPISEILFPFIFTGIAFIMGNFCGIQFPLAGTLYYNQGRNQNNGVLYSLDLSGAMIGALLFSALIIPLLGMYIAGYLLALINIFIALLYTILHIKSKY